MERNVVRPALFATVVAAWVGVLGACMSGSSLILPSPDGGTGGASSSGGNSGQTSSGGAPASGGSPATGGTSGVGGASGAMNSGGITGAGGMTGPGGTTGGGGTIATGGASTGEAGKAGPGGAGSGGMGGMGGGVVNTGPIQVLLWNNALGFGHAARANAIPLFKARESTDNIKFDTTYAHTATATDGPSDTSFDASVFTDAGLDRYDVIMFLHAAGNTIDDSQKNVRRQAFQDFIQKKGRGFVGTHSATDTYQNGTWPWYVDFIGANFHEHSAAGVSGTARYYQNLSHPILTAAATPNPWNRSEEWYAFTRDPLSSAIPGIKILLTCHDQTITTERPTAWVHEMPQRAGAPRGGRMFYTAMGHSTSAFMEKAVMDLVINGIKWAAHRLN
jgi:type 1 glutamine amidotransferase